MQDQFSRTRMFFGTTGMERLFQSRVAVFGIGGVGGYTAEALVRSGVGHIALIDDDKICLTNLNRQIIATHDTVGQYKVDVMAQRIAAINPHTAVETHRLFYTPDTADSINLADFDYIVDAVDTVTAKLELVTRAGAANVPIISAMGAGGKLDPTAFIVADIFSTEYDPLARAMRRELRTRGITALKVVYSKEPTLKPAAEFEEECRRNCVCPPGTVRKCTARHQIPASNAFVPPAVGLILAGEVIKDLIGGNA